MNEHINEIHQLLLSERDEDYLKSISVLVPTEMPVLGVRVPQVRGLVKQWHKTHSLPYEQAIELVNALFCRQIREELLFATFVLQNYKKQFGVELFNQIDQWIELIENWEVCDQLAVVLAPIVAKNPQLFDTLERWTCSDNHWRKRMVLVTGASLNHHGLSHVEPVMQWCDKLYNDTHPMVAKAWHWAVREVSKKDQHYVFVWLDSRKAKIKRGLLRQAAQKLSPEQLEQLLS